MIDDDVETVGPIRPSPTSPVAQGPLWAVFPCFDLASYAQCRRGFYLVAWADEKGTWYQVRMTGNKNRAARFAKQMAGHHPDEPV